MRWSNIFILCIVLACFISTNELFAQSEGDTVITIVADPRIDLLADRFNRTHEIKGYRIQIISSSRKEPAKKELSKFVANHQEIQAYEIYQQPFFIIKVGDFLTKLEAEKFHMEIEEEFPDSFILPDLITPLKQYTYEVKY